MPFAKIAKVTPAYFRALPGALGLHGAHMKLLALLCSLVLAVEANAAEALRIIPNVFQGVWASYLQENLIV